MTNRLRPEDAARALLFEHGPVRLPVDIDAIARGQGATVRYQPFDGDVSGMLVRGNGGPVIGVNSAQSRTRQRFTVAHELGHLVLHTGKELFVDKAIRVRYNLRDTRASLGTDAEERQANAFAAELLMPAQEVHAAFEAFVAGRFSVSDRHLVADLAARFDVSEQAMEYRLVNLKLLAPFGMAGA